MATHADVEMLNRSMQNLGDSFVQKRQEKRQTGLDATRQRERDMEIQIQQDRAAKATAHEKAMEGKQDAILQHQQGRDALRQVEQAHGKLIDAVKSGAMTPEQANAAARRMVDQMRKGPDTIISNSPFVAFLDDPNADLFSAPAAKSVDSMPKPFDRDPNKEYITRGGALIPKAKPSPTEMETVTEEFPATEGKAAVPPSTTGSLWWKKEVPGTPGTPGTPAKKVTRKVPVGTSSGPFPTPPAPATNAPAATAPQAKTPVNPDAAIAEANEAIKKGADPAKVKARLLEMGVQVK